MCQLRAVPATYTCDATNHLVSEVSNKTGSNVLVTYTYDDNNRLTTENNAHIHPQIILFSESVNL